MLRCTKRLKQIGAIALLTSLCCCTQLINKDQTQKEQSRVLSFSCTQLSDLIYDKSGQSTSINFVNTGTAPLDLYWLEPDGSQHKYFNLTPGKSQIQSTYTHHYWLAKDSDGACMGVYKNTNNSLSTIEIKGKTEHPSKSQPLAEPPFHGTIFLEQNIILGADPNAFLSIKSAGKGTRTMYDRRVEKFIQTEAFLYKATYTDSLTIEVQVNQEFESADKALPFARKYARAVGFLTTELRKDVKTMWIHKGLKLFGGGNQNILIHTEQALVYERDGILEETLVHEASHTSLDNYHASNEDWVKAQTSDANFISRYARDNPQREDIAETYLLYMALRYRPERISDQLKETILKTIPNRINYFDQQSFRMFPMVR